MTTKTAKKGWLKPQPTATPAVQTTTTTTHALSCALCGCEVASRTGTESTTEARRALALWWQRHVQAAQHGSPYVASRWQVWRVRSLSSHDQAA